MSTHKIIRDIALGFIEVDENIIRIIDTPSFQRLRNIAQLTAQHLFPSTNHTRFEHSIGVMYLSERIFAAIQNKIVESGCEDEMLNYLYFHLKYAALLHDVGHAPFSHIGEFFYDVKEIEVEIKKLLGEEAIEWIAKGTAHEKMSCYVIARNYNIMLEEIYSSTNSCYQFDIEFIFRIITGTKYLETKVWMKDIIIEILNSSSIDADKLDYLIRDNYMAGGIAPTFSLDRFLLSITIDDKHKIAYTPVGISSVVNIIDCRDFLYTWLYNHHTVVYTDFLYKEMIRHLLNVPSSLSENSIKWKNYFSCNAISGLRISDVDFRAIFRREAISTLSKYSKRVLGQLEGRQFYKPLWKTIFEYNQFMKDKFDDREKKEIEKVIENEEMRRRIVKDLSSICEVDSGQIFLIPRSNKFYSMNSNAEFFVDINQKSVSLDKVFPLRKFYESYSNIAFYVFVCKECYGTVSNIIADVLKRYVCS